MNTVDCARCSTTLTFDAPLTNISGPRLTTSGEWARTVWNRAPGRTDQLDAYCFDCYFAIGCPTLIDTTQAAQ